jgi:hypothetical protein
MEIDMLTKEKIVELLSSNDRAVERALMLLYQRQTADEQTVESTRHLNNRGFRPAHARMGTSMGRLAYLGYKLSEKQINYWRKTDRAGNMRIGIYWRQLIEEAQKKAMG